MSPRTLVYEGPIPGRPDLTGQTIKVETTDVDVGGIHIYKGVVRQADHSGVVIDLASEERVVIPAPFNYEVLKDA